LLAISALLTPQGISMACCCVVTSTGTNKLIESCGKFSHIAKPGISFIIPFVNNTSGTISMRIQQLDVACETKSKDNVFVTMRVSVQYQVINHADKIRDAHYRLTNPRVQIESYVFDVLRSTIPKLELDQIFLEKDEIQNDIASSLKDSMASFGYEILGTPITDIDPDREVKRAMNEINKNKRLRVAAEDEGEAVKIRAIKEAEAEASRTEIQAKADAEAKFLAGQGVSRQRQAIMEGLRESVNAFKNEVAGVDAKTVMDLMIVTQYFDMMKDVGAQGKTNAVFLNSSGGGDMVAEGMKKGFLAGLPAAPGFAMSR